MNRRKASFIPPKNCLTTMRRSTLAWQRAFCLFLIICLAKIGTSQTAAQTLRLQDFTIWGGSAAANPYISSQGIVFNNTAVIQGNVGSNHLINVKNNLTITGSIYSGNLISFSNNAKITGNVFANRSGTTTNPAIAWGSRDTITGNLTANGKMTFGTYGKITGQVAVPAPTQSNYSGPTPSILPITNSFTLPTMPVMPDNSPFDGNVATNVASNIITNPTTSLAPGVYRKIALTGNKTLTFSGPGNYIFYEVDNGTTTNNFVFDFKTSTRGTINIFVIKDARWGLLSVSMKNGGDPSRIYTEVHGNGSTNSGNCFDLQGPKSIPAGSNLWLGNVWAPNGAISITSCPILPTGASHIIGALWSGKLVTIKNDFKITYQAPATGPYFETINPSFAAPLTGKIDPANNIIGPELFALSKDTADTIKTNDIFVIQTSRDSVRKVLLDVISKSPNDADLKSQLIALGMTNQKGAPGTINNGSDMYTVTGYFPVDKITQLNTNTKINFAHPSYPPISNVGAVTTQGDLTMRSNFVRSRFGVDGSGIKIGVISDSYNAKLGAQADVNEGDLPGITTTDRPNDNQQPVQVLEDFLDQRAHDEGRAMLQIAHDLAPGAKLAFCTGSLSGPSFARAIDRLASDTLPGGRCNVIVDDITYIDEPFLSDGEIAQAVNRAVANGVIYFSSAGNFGKQSYEGVFHGVTNTSVMATGQIHNFAYDSIGTDLYQSVHLRPGSYAIVLQWSDSFPSLGSNRPLSADLDLYIMDQNGFRLFGFNRSIGDPFEVCPFTVRDETDAKIMVVRASGTADVRFKYIIFRGDATILNHLRGTSTIVGHPNSDSAIAVGAMLYANIPPFTPVWPGVASFSSRGGTQIVANSTTLPPRNKPELIAPNGVNTSVDLGGPAFNDGDTYPNFFGTSAAAPHAAAVAALLIQARKKYLKLPAGPEITVLPYDVKRQLISSAGKFSYLPGNFSFEGGYGYVQADSAIQQIANARPVISTLKAVDSGAQYGAVPFKVKITGRYLTSTTKIYVDSIPIPATTDSIDAATGVGTATATVPAIAFGNDPAYRLYSSAKSPSQQDGGFSEALHFFSSNTKIIVKAELPTHNNFSRMYGQENPVFAATVTVVNGTDSLDIGQTSLTLAELKLDSLVFITNATEFSSPRSFSVSVDRKTPLSANDPLLGLYTFDFEPGTLQVQKMKVRITPNLKVVKYGEDISGITYTYQFDTSGIVSPQLLEEVKSMHNKYVADNALIVVNGFNIDSVTGGDLSGMGMLASFQSVLNARKFIVEDGQLKPLTSTLSTSQIGQQRFIVDVSAQSLQNYKRDSGKSTILVPLPGTNARGFLNVKALTNGNAKAAIPGGQLQAMVNGQLLAMVNGQLQAIVNGQLKAMVNNLLVDATDMAFENGQLLAMVNQVWTPIPSGEILATVNGQQVTVDLSVSNGQLQAMVNGEAMSLVNGQLQAMVNGQLLAIVNGQLQAIVNSQLTPLVNDQLMGIANGQLQAIVNGQLLAIVNGQLMVELDNGDLAIADGLILSNGQLQAMVNGQLQAIVNGQLKAMVNGVVTDIPTTSFSLVNGQLQAIVNGEDSVAYVNGQLQAIVNGQLQAMVNGAAVKADSVIMINGQLKAMVNGAAIPIENGQLQAMVNGQLLAMVNGQLMAMVNGQVTFAVFTNGQLQAMVNGQFTPFVNGQLLAMVNGELQQVNSYSIVNGQLQAIVNGETWVYPNGQLMAIVNGQLQPLVNNFDVSGTNNNSKTVVLVDEDDINLQSGDVGGMLSVNMITGLDAGYQALIPAAFVNENFEVTYGLGQVLINKKPLIVSADNKAKNTGDPNPPLTTSYKGFAFDDTTSSLCITPVLIDQNERRTKYTDVKINNTSNVYFAAPGESLTLTGNWSENHFQNIFPGYGAYCPGCITQYRIGMADGSGGNVFATCDDVSGLGSYGGFLNQTFNAPSTPGVYYITQITTWWYTCPAPNFGDPPQIPIHNNGPNDAIAVVVVNPYSIPTYTTATTSSPEGTYPIVVGGCFFNPNYRVVFEDGTLSVGPAALTYSRPQIEAATNSPDRLYPNPASNSIMLRLKNDVQTVNDIKIYDSDGKISRTLARKLGEGFYEINVSTLPRGVYVIKATTAVGIKTFKFIKM